MENLLLMSDSYKYSHYKQYPPNTTKVFSYFESRGGKYDQVVFFGLQYFIKKYLAGQVVTQEKIDEAEKIINAHMGDGLFYREGWEYILKEYGGRLPIKIRAVEEGTVVDGHNVLFTIENTDPKCFWLTNFIETLLVQVWYPCTVATTSREVKKVIKSYLEKTGCSTEGLVFKLHDFGCRGVSSIESAGIGGCAHLVNFMGTDTVPALVVARDYYGCEMAGFSIPASEHSTMTSWGKEHEVDAMRNMLKQYEENPLVACVSDSYDIYNACENIWGKALKKMIVNKKGTLVVRPDSGDPTTVPIEIIEILMKKFGYIRTSTGHRLLPPFIRVIQGDGMTPEQIEVLLEKMFQAGLAADNIAFGMGGGLLQRLHRDVLKFALKCSYMEIDGKGRDVYKDPVTDKGKQSKKGRLGLVKFPDGYHTYTQDLILVDSLKDVFIDGNLINEQNFVSIRERAKV